MPVPVERRAIGMLLIASYLARVPVTAISLALILAMRESDRGYAAAGLVTGVYVAGLAITAPRLGSLADRFGAPWVFGVGAPLCGLTLAAFAVGVETLPLGALLVVAVVAGASLPPLGALTRGFLTPLVPDEERRSRLFAIDATAQEICFIGGPLVLAGLLALGSARQALVVLAALLAIGAAGYALAARPLPRPSPMRRAEAPSPLSSRGLRALLGVTVLIGVMFGAIELGIAAALEEQGSRDAAGLYLGIWSVGSLVGGVLAVRFPTTDPARRQVRALALAALSALLIVPAAGSGVLLAGALVVQGVSQAPLMAVGYAIVPRVTSGRLSEAFAWLTSAVVAGIAVGTTLAGLVSDQVSPAAAFAVGAAAPVVGLVLARQIRVTRIAASAGA